MVRSESSADVPTACGSSTGQSIDVAVERNPADRLRRFDQLILCTMLVALLILCGMTVLRSAFLENRLTDADVYFRAAWAVRTGDSLYTITDTRGWHYLYPPLLAILLTPLADPLEEPVQDVLAPVIPFPVAVFIWYWVNVGVLVLSAHLLASALERSLERHPQKGFKKFGRRWWRLRAGPVFVCALGIGGTLGCGQANLLMLLSLCGLISFLGLGRDWRAGLFLGLGSCIKVYSGVMILYPIWKRNWRCCAGFFSGLLAGLVLIPFLVLGPVRFLDVYEEFYQLRLKGVLTLEPVPEIEAEVRTTTGAFQSYGTVLFKSIYRDRSTRPRDLPRGFRIYEVSLTLLLLGATFLAWGWKRGRPGRGSMEEILLVGALAAALVGGIPSTKAHYFALVVPVVAGLMASACQRNGFPRQGPLLTGLFCLHFSLFFLPEIPGLRWLGEMGAIPYSTLALWLVAVIELRRRSGQDVRQERLESGHR